MAPVIAAAVLEAPLPAATVTAGVWRWGIRSARAASYGLKV